MSIAAMQWAFKQRIKPSTVKFVLVALADNADVDGRAWPSVPDICEKTGQDRKTVILSLDRLEKNGFLTDTGERKGRTSQVKVYRLNLRKEAADSEPLNQCVTLSGKKSKDSEFGIVSISNDADIGTVQNGKACRLSHETVPFFLSKSANIPEKSTENGTGNHTEPLLEPALNPQGCNKSALSIHFNAGPLPAASAAGSPKKNSDDPADPAIQVACRNTWNSYRLAYCNRYKVEPVRNVKINAQVRQLVTRLGHAEAPLVAAWYLNHPKSFYVGRCHDFGALVTDAEKLRTEWATGKYVTAGMANTADRKGTTGSALQEAIARKEAAKHATP